VRRLQQLREAHRPVLRADQVHHQQGGGPLSGSKKPLLCFFFFDFFLFISFLVAVLFREGSNLRILDAAFFSSGEGYLLYEESIGIYF